MFAQQDVDAVLGKVFSPGIHEIPFHILEFVIDFPDQALTSVF